MSLGFPKMTDVTILNARRPWLTTESFNNEQDMRIFKKYLNPEYYDQDEIEMCLNCPFATCEGNMRKCSHYRYSYLAQIKKRE